MSTDESEKVGGCISGTPDPIGLVFAVLLSICSCDGSNDQPNGAGGSGETLLDGTLDGDATIAEDHAADRAPPTAFPLLAIQVIPPGVTATRQTLTVQAKWRGWTMRSPSTRAKLRPTPVMPPRARMQNPTAQAKQGR